MTAQFLTVTILLLLVCAAALALWLDARQRRMDRRLEAALPASHVDIETSIRRLETRPRAAILQRLVNYRSGIPYALHPAYVLLAGGLVAAAVFYANRFFGYSALLVSVVAAVVALIVVRGLFRWQQRRFADRLFRQLPDTIQLVTSTIRSGLPVQEAFRTIARDMPEPTAGQFKIVCNELALGRTAAEAVENVYRRTQVTEYAIFAVTLGVQLKSGGSLAETLLTLADTITQRVGLAARARALAGEVIFSSRALSMAPLVIGGFLYLISPSMIDMLFTDPTGNKLLAYAVGSVVTGHFVIRWMIRRETAL
jgi:tight adherence protein B